MPVRYAVVVTLAALALPHVAGLLCTFEPNMTHANGAAECGGWIWTPHDDSVKVVTGEQALDIVMSEPPGDMTAAVVDADNNTNGHYLLLFNWGSEVRGNLVSPWFRESGAECRLRMDVHYFSADRSHIAVVVNRTSAPGTPVYVTGKYGRRKTNTWDTFTEKIGRISEPFQLTIEARVLPGRPRNHIGIDNLQLVDCGRATMGAVDAACSSDHFRCDNGKCLAWDRVCDITSDCLDAEDELQQCDELPDGARCDFERDNCGWRPDRGQLQWRRHTGPAATSYTGPDSDHTLATSLGHYMFLNIKGGDFAYYAVLKSPWMPPMPFYNRQKSSPYYQSCMLRFYLHLYGSHVGELSVFIVDADNGRSVVWRQFGARTNSWVRVLAPLPVVYNSSYFLEFQGTRSFGNIGNMGLDDISLSPECFAKLVPVALSQHYNYDLNNSSTWEIKTNVETEPNGTVYTFGTCGASGATGPQQRACLLAYKETNVSVHVLDDPGFRGFQRWTVPSSGIYAIVAAGASGGRGFNSNNGVSRATEAVSVVQLTAGEQLYMVIGQEGTNACNQNASHSYRESCQSRYSTISSETAEPLEYHAALRQIMATSHEDHEREMLNRDWSPPNSQPIRGVGWRVIGSGGRPQTDALDTISRLVGRRIPNSIGNHQRTRPLLRLRRDISDSINSLKKMQFVGGGGGGGGGTFVFKISQETAVPLVAAGGGGGLADDGGGVVRPHARGENSTAGNQPGRSVHSDRAGPGGGWNGTSKSQSAGMSLLLGAEGGAPCTAGTGWHTYGGFGGGGGGCSAGGGGGGFAGGGAYKGSDQNGEGGMSFTTGLYRIVREASHLGSGQVHVIPAFQGCGCDHLCVAVDDQLLSRRCLCRNGWYLASDKVTCKGVGGGASGGVLVHWSATLLVVTAVLAVLFLLVLAILIVCYYSTYQRKKSLSQRRQLASLQLNRLRNSAGDILTEYNPHYEFGGTLPCSVNELKEISRDRLTLVKQLGQGAFGLVYQGYLRSSASDSVEMSVAVKTLAELSAPHAELDFVMEAAIMSRFEHANIVRLIGVSFDRHPRYIVLELLAGGDLKSFLREIRPTKERDSSLTMADLLTCAIDVANGLQYLEVKRFIHRDIAARNCLLTTKGPGRVVKIADFGMSRDIYRADYYRKGGRTMIPVKWMPPEAFLDGLFTSKTDVWSFGVLLWEVVSMGQLPYPGHTNSEVMKLVAEGGRLPPPSFCPPPIEYVMTQCWQHSPDKRPCFTAVLELLIACRQDSGVLACRLPLFDKAGCHDHHQPSTSIRPRDGSRPLTIFSLGAVSTTVISEQSDQPRAQKSASLGRQYEDRRRRSSTDYLLPTPLCDRIVTSSATDVSNALQHHCEYGERAGLLLVTGVVGPDGAGRTECTATATSSAGIDSTGSRRISHGSRNNKCDVAKHSRIVVSGGHRAEYPASSHGSAAPLREGGVVTSQLMAVSEDVNDKSLMTKRSDFGSHFDSSELLLGMPSFSPPPPPSPPPPDSDRNVRC